jgi:hypothetical protein
MENDGTRLRLRWAAQGDPAPEPAAVEAVRTERMAAFGRLISLLGNALPVMEQETEVAS